MAKLIGKHEELLRTNMLYKKLVEQQLVKNEKGVQNV